MRAVWLLCVCACAGVSAQRDWRELTFKLFHSTFDDLVKAAAATCEILPLDRIFSQEKSEPVDVVEYTREGIRTFSLRQATRFLPPEPHELVIYVPGWRNTPTDKSSRTLIRALLQRNPSILVLDTTEPFGQDYIRSAAQVNGVAHQLNSFITNIYSYGFPLSSIHIIGFSLGAHVAGVTGKLLQSHLNEKLEKITALDPARPCFSRPSQFRLDKSDAKFVQVVHTSSVVGLEDPLGHADVYVNGLSVPQPECRGLHFTLKCDHSQAWKLFSASVVDEWSLMGRECRSWGEVVSEQCSGNETMVGYACSADTRGMFVHKTFKMRNFDPFDWRGRWFS